MSFDPNDNMNTIHLGNYEEFFVLYMDNELSDAQVKMVDEFLAANPDLKNEFEMLMITKLPLEKFSFDKKDLLAENIKLTSVGEELLLYIDDELPADKKKTVELEISSNKDYQLQHQSLLQTKLDLSEKIEYPNKKELYRRTERVIPIKMWMRVAAAVVIVAVGGILYFSNNSKSSFVTPPVAKIPTKSVPNQPPTQEISPVTNTNNIDQETVVADASSKKESQQPEKKIEIKEEKTNEQPLVAVNETPQNEDLVQRNRTTDVQFDDKTIALADYKDVNTSTVTSLAPNRTTISGTPTIKEGEPTDRKGSVKGFLRKATRMIEKRTGIDPTNENGQLLIGAVAINLK
jgi:hypothetical protein